jgi:diketogulonate reductase-like aldo/keto reductase
MSTLNLATRQTMNDGQTIPQLGLGLFQIPDEVECERAVQTALEYGCRHFDTAATYGNEAVLGRVLATAGVPRSELFITTKCWISDFGRRATRTAFEKSLARLGLDYLDLYLLHWPSDPHMMEAWETLLELRAEGLCRSVGVSNFSVRRFEEIFFRHTSEVPAVNQVELHPFGSRPDVRDYCQRKNMLVESYSPLAQAQRLDHPLFAELGRALGKSPAQVVLRWHLQRGLVVIPKSKTPQRIRENLDLFGFELTPAQMAQIDALNEDLSVIEWRPDNGKNWY